MMERKALIRMAAVALLALGFALALAFIVPDGHRDFVCFSGSCVEVEVARTQQELSRGLMERESLAESSGMLFVFGEEGVHMFWMKNTLISLDMIWMDAAGRVIYVERDVPPCRTSVCPTYGPHARSMYVLEVNAGYAERNGFRVGDAARLP